MKIGIYTDLLIITIEPYIVYFGRIFADFYIYNKYMSGWAPDFTLDNNQLPILMKFENLVQNINNLNENLLKKQIDKLFTFKFFI